MSKNSKPSKTKYIIISLLILVIALFVAAITSNLLFVILKTNKPIEHMVNMLEGIIGAIATGLVLYQLKTSEKAEVHQNDIEEASFILQYNQTFIQDPNMMEVERLLEDQVYYSGKKEIINPENRQKFINYLVYLESLAPLVINNVLRLDYIDNLMAYRFFLAIDNAELQEKEIKPFADYYRGCFVLYKIWRDYRETKGYSFPNNDCKNKEFMKKLNSWDSFSKYATV